MPRSWVAAAAGTLAVALLTAGCAGAAADPPADPPAGPAAGPADDAATAATSAAPASPAASAANPATTSPVGLRAPAPAAVRPPVSDDGLPPVVSRVDTTDPVVFITIDDGYRKDPRLVDLMRRRGVPITVFATDAAVRDDYRYFDTVRAAGATVQNHSMTHPALKARDLATNEREICGASDVYATQYGQRPWLLRPPYGSWSDTTRRAAKACGIDYVVMWSVSQPGRYLRFGEGDRLRPGDIILLHFQGDFVTYLNRTLTIIERAGLRVGALEDYLPARG